MKKLDLKNTQIKLHIDFKEVQGCDIDIYRFFFLILEGSMVSAHLICTGPWV